MDDFELIVNVGIPLALVALGYFAGSINEKRHYRSIEERENLYLSLPAISLKQGFDESRVGHVWLVSANVVVSLDYFKRFLAALRNIIGGRVTAYETLVDRARREALLRLKERAEGADIIVNLRIETSCIGRSADQRRSIGSIEALAYGTALSYR